MAKEEQDESVEQAGAGGSKKKLIIMIVGGIVALLIIIATTLFFAGFFDAKETAEPAEPAKEVSSDTVNEDEGDGEGDKESVKEVSYYSLSPSFLVNFQKGDIKVLKVDMSLMASDDKVIDAVTLHNPVIRNNILMMLSSQNPETLKSTEGKLALQAAVKEEVNKVLVDKKITSKVQEVFFTDLVMQ